MTRIVAVVMEAEGDDMGWIICRACQGSGEGQHEGSRCLRCRGLGEIRVSDGTTTNERRHE